MTQELTLYVPTGGSTLIIADGSAIAGTPSEDGRVLVDYEGGLYRPDMEYETKLQHACGRHVMRYPTVARMHARAGELKPVGTARRDPALLGWVVAEITDPDALCQWLNGADLPPVGGSRAMKERAAGHWANKIDPFDLSRIQATSGTYAQTLDALIDHARARGLTESEAAGA